jgi:ribosomal protein S18 acetylase RimI-like enzyme
MTPVSAYTYRMLTIREVRDDELLKAADLWSDFMDFNAQFNDSFITKDKAREIFTREMMEKYPASEFRLAVAELDGDLVGFCFSYVSRKPKYFKLEKFGFVGDLYVRPENRRAGVGHDLVKDAINFLARQKVSQIELLVSVKNKNAIQFWEAIGFSHLLTWMYKRI